MPDRFVELRHGLISMADHVQEHPRVWLDRVPAALLDRVPQVKRQGDGSERWMLEGQLLELGGVAAAAAMLPDRTGNPQRWAEVPAAVWDPVERLAVMDGDGVDVSVLYPTVAGMAGENLARLADPELQRVCVEAYNDWLIDEWAQSSARFIPLCIVPLSSIDATVAEVKRAVGRGHRGVILPSIPADLQALPHSNDLAWEPLWATCEELGVPICFQAGEAQRVQLAPHTSYSPALADALRAMTRPVSTVFVLVNLLMSRILLRHPGLQAVFAESGIAWAAYLLEYADHQFEKDLLFNSYELKPSEMFRRQCCLTAWYEDMSLETRDFIGTDNIAWSTNFPLATSTWPNTRAMLARWGHRVPDEERARMLWGNAARIYGIDTRHVGAGFATRASTEPIAR